MDRRRFLQSLAALGVAVPASALAPRAARASVDRAVDGLAGTSWWVPVLRAWAEGASSPALDAFCDALEVPPVTECPRIDVAVARLLLGGIQDRLPAWTAALDGGFASARHVFPRRLDGAPDFEPIHVATIDWALSAPGFSWPEAYHVVAIPELGLQAVTASRDSEDAMGCTDHALGWRPLSMSARVAVRELLREAWTLQAEDFGQAAWEAVVSPGLLDGPALDALRDAVWEGGDD